MFLDLPGYRHVARLEQELTSRGAVSHCLCVCWSLSVCVLVCGLCRVRERLERVCEKEKELDASGFEKMRESGL